MTICFVLFSTSVRKHAHFFNAICTHAFYFRCNFVFICSLIFDSSPDDWCWNSSDFFRSNNVNASHRVVRVPPFFCGWTNEKRDYEWFHGTLFLFKALIVWLCLRFDVVCVVLHFRQPKIVQCSLGFPLIVCKFAALRIWQTSRPFCYCFNNTFRLRESWARKFRQLTVCSHDNLLLLLKWICVCCSLLWQNQKKKEEKNVFSLAS